MARQSYFGNMVRGGGVSRLTPPRPVANLWKSARLDWVANDAAAEVATRPASARVQASSPAPAAARPALLPIVPPRPQGRAKKVSAPATVAALVPKEHAMPRAAELKPAVRTNQSAPSLRAERRTASSDVPQATPELQPQAISRLLGAAPLPAEHREKNEPPQHVYAFAHTSAEEPLTQSIAHRPMPLEPARRREAQRSEQAASAQRERRWQQKNTIQIGRIEVQVVSPPAVVQRVAPAPPTARLARGYTLWSNW
jgi:hypothetical protein